jgi:hypothetical protein
MFCPKCGTESSDDSQFCRKCGQGISVASTGGVAAAVAPARVATSTDETRKAETRRGRGGRIVALLVIVFLVWIFIQQNMGTKGATQMVATAVHAPIELKNETESLRASSWKAIPFNVTYSGTVNIDLDVVSGNPINVFVTTPDQVDVMKQEHWSEVRAYPDFNAVKTKTYRRNAQLGQGAFYLIIRDTSLGILSASASDVSVKVTGPIFCTKWSVSVTPC